MPLNAIPPTTTVANLGEKIEASKGQCRVDVGFWGGVIPGNEVSYDAVARELAKLILGARRTTSCLLQRPA